MKYLIMLSAFFASCNFYAVHEDMKPLEINFKLHNNKDIRKLIDSVNAINFCKNCSLPNIEIDEKSDILYLDNCEGYLFAIEKNKIVLNAFTVNKEYWTTKKEQVSDTLFIYCVKETYIYFSRT